MIESICHYVLSQDHERENTIENMIGNYDFDPPNVIKKRLWNERFNHIYYSACVLRYGKREANKMYRECIKEAMK